MKVEESVNEITLKETPGCLWFVGLFFAIVSGIFLYGVFGGFSNWDEIPTWQMALAFLFGVIGLSVGVWIISNAPITSVSINRLTNTVLIKQYGFFGKREYFHKFEEIKGFHLIEEKDSEGDLIWSMAMGLKNGEVIKISNMPTHAREYQNDHVFQINEFMRKEMPSYKDSLELSD